MYEMDQEEKRRTSSVPRTPLLLTGSSRIVQGPSIGLSWVYVIPPYAVKLVVDYESVVHYIPTSVNMMLTSSRRYIMKRRPIAHITRW